MKLVKKKPSQSQLSLKLNPSSLLLLEVLNQPQLPIQAL
jgi:hypothetical protein